MWQIIYFESQYNLVLFSMGRKRLSLAFLFRYDDTFRLAPATLQGCMKVVFNVALKLVLVYSRAKFDP